MVTNGLENILKATGNMEVTAVYHSASSLLDNIHCLDAHIIILDLQLPDGNGYDIAKAILQIYPAMEVLVFSSTDAPHQVKKMLQLGCKGYLLKNAANGIILQAVKAVYKGARFLSPELEEVIINKTFERKKETHKINLTAREKEVLALIADEFTNQEIANKLFMGLSTIEFHRTNMFRKLGVKNTAGLVRVAAQTGLV